MENANNAFCWSCAGAIASEDNYCRFCGKGQGRRVPWYYRHWGIILLTPLALGPFSLILVWRSPVLSRGAKWAYTAVILAVTWYIALKLYALCMLFRSLLAPMTDPANSQFGNLGVV